MPNKSTAHKYLGYSAEDQLAPHAAFYQESVASARERLESVIEQSKRKTVQLPPFSEVAQLDQTGLSTLETGYSIADDGSIRVAVYTPMPGVIPNMWDWWFGWHGCQDSRYKLWHPLAHLSASWEDGDQHRVAYLGRTSMIQEYIGKKLERANIRFIQPTELGFDSSAIADPTQQVLICARVGYTHLPIDIGWLVHQVRAVEGGTEMRSRFWIGGPHIEVRGKIAWAKYLTRTLQKNVRPSEHNAQALLQHCSEEMQHLAGFLPALYQQFH